MTSLTKRLIVMAGVLGTVLAYALILGDKSDVSIQNNLVKKITAPYLGYQKSKEEASKEIFNVKHQIEKGDTFSKIAERYGVSTNYIVASNPGKEATDLQIGDYLKFEISKKELMGYLPPTSEENIEKNRSITQDMDSEKIKKIREDKRLQFITYMNGIKPGEFDTNKEIIRENLEKLKPHLNKNCDIYKNLNLENMLAMGYVESRFNPFTSSKTGSLGIFGNVLSTYGYDYNNNPFEISEHTNQNCKKYSDLKKTFDGSEKLAIISFNAGDAYAKKAIKNLAEKNNIKGKNITKLIKQLRKKGFGVNQILKEMKNMKKTGYQKERILEGFEYYDRVQNAKRILKKEILFS